MKTARVLAVTCIEVECPYCGGECASIKTGSMTMITQEDERLRCLECGKYSLTPQRAFAPRKAAVKRAAAEAASYRTD